MVILRLSLRRFAVLGGHAGDAPGSCGNLEPQLPTRRRRSLFLELLFGVILVAKFLIIVFTLTMHHSSCKRHDNAVPSGVGDGGGANSWLGSSPSRGEDVECYELGSH